MYLDYFSLRQPPFALDADTAFFHPDAARRELLGALSYSARHGGGIIKLTGERGSGMSMLCRALARQLADQASVVHLQAEQLSPLGVVHATAIALGLDPDGKLSDEVMRMLQSHLEQTHADGKHAVLMVEQADTLPPETLEEIRLLTNLETPQHKLLQVVLLGQPELNAMLRQPAMRQLRERITLSFVMPGIAPADVADLLAHRLRAAGRAGPDLFASDAARVLAGAAQGDLRRLMTLADKALKAAASVQSQAVAPSHVQAAIKDKEAAPRGRRLARPVVAGALAALAVLGLGVAALTFRQPAPPSKPAAKAAPAQVQAAAASAAAPAVPEAPATITPPDDGKRSTGTLPQTDAPSMPAAAPSPAQAPAVQTLAASTHEAAAATANGSGLLQQSLRASKAWLRDESEDHFSIQIENFPADEAKRAEAFLEKVRDAIGLRDVHAYPMLIDGERRIAIVYGSFKSAKQALETQALLTEGWGIRPKMRNIKGIRAAVARAEAG